MRDCVSWSWELGRVMMGVREIDRSLEQRQMGVKDLRRRMILAPRPRERERWYALWLLTQGWTAAATAEALERDPHTITHSISSGGRRPSAREGRQPSWNSYWRGMAVVRR